MITALVNNMVKPSDKKLRRPASLAAKYKAREIKQRLDSLSDQMPSLSELESAFNLSRGHLQLGFQELYGTSIGNYTKAAKLKLIKKLLKDYTLTLDSIAVTTGYNGGEALCRFFKMMEGVSPGQWRRDYLNSIP